MWMLPETAPRDGTWILLRYEEDKVKPCVGCWWPNVCKIGNQWITYEWRVWQDGEWNWWPHDRVEEWRHLPTHKDVA